MVTKGMWILLNFIVDVQHHNTQPTTKNKHFAAPGTIQTGVKYAEQWLKFWKGSGFGRWVRGEVG